jgi:hypothetical protein
MTNETQENIVENLSQLGYVEDKHLPNNEDVRFFVFQQMMNDTPTVIIAIYYTAPLTMKNSGLMFKEGGEVMMKYLNNADGTEDTQTKVAFILALSAGISPTMLSIHTLSSGLTKISSRKLRPTILYSPKKQSSIMILESAYRLVKRNGNNKMGVSFSDKNLRNTHEEALRLAK